MEKDRFDFVCLESESGRDVFVRNSVSGEEGRVTSCAADHLMVDAAAGERRCWDFHGCEEVGRSKDEWPRR
ncbi:MAG TPA: hypothetical protein VJ955_03195 [Desulfuromonadales bacterium]|nr:hypothetical protein [Desulfuromonadales bacterium]